MQRKGCKEIELSNSLEANKCLETCWFITSNKIAEEILCSKSLVDTEDAKVTTEKEIVLLVEGQTAWSTARKFTKQRRGILSVMQVV